MKKQAKINDIIRRIKRKNAVGILFNTPDSELVAIHNKLLEEKHLVFKALDVYTSRMLLFRLGSRLNIKDLSFDMLPSLIGEKMIVITGADIIKESYARVLSDMAKYKVPIMLLMNNGSKIKDLRKLPVYNSILTIEQDYSAL